MISELQMKHTGKMANVMLEILDGFSLVWVLMKMHTDSTILQVTLFIFEL